MQRIVAKMFEGSNDETGPCCRTYWDYHDRGCPSFRGFRKLGTTDLDAMVSYSRFPSSAFLAKGGHTRT